MILAPPLLLPLAPECSEGLLNPPDILLDCNFLIFLQTLGHFRELPHFRTSEPSEYLDNCLQNTWRHKDDPFPPFLVSAAHL